MAYISTASSTVSFPFRAVAQYLRSSFDAAEKFATQGEQAKKIHYLGSLSDARLARMGLVRDEIVAFVCKK